VRSALRSVHWFGTSAEGNESLDVWLKHRPAFFRLLPVNIGYNTENNISTLDSHAAMD